MWLEFLRLSSLSPHGKNMLIIAMFFLLENPPFGRGYQGQCAQPSDLEPRMALDPRPLGGIVVGHMTTIICI